MGLIKTAIIGGAAVYGINKLAKTAEARSNSPNQQRQRDFDRGDQYYNQPGIQNRSVEYRDYPDERPQPQYQQYQERDSRPQYYGKDSKQRSYYQDNQPYYGEPSNAQRFNDEPRFNRQSDQMRIDAAPPQYSSYQRRPQGFVESEEVMAGAQSRGNSKTDMVSILAQQAMKLGLIGGSDKDKNKK